MNRPRDPLRTIEFEKSFRTHYQILFFMVLAPSSYKKNVNDTRESPALEIINLLKKRRAKINYHDPHINELYKTRKFNFKYKSIRLSKKIIKEYDAIIIVTDHDKINYTLLENNSKMIFAHFSDFFRFFALFRFFRA